MSGAANDYLEWTNADFLLGKDLARLFKFLIYLEAIGRSLARRVDELLPLELRWPFLQKRAGALVLVLGGAADGEQRRLQK